MSQPSLNHPFLEQTRNKNYVDSKRNLDIVLIVDKHKWILTTPCPPQTNDDSTQEDKDALAAWLRSDEIVRCYILASMNDVLQPQHHDIETAADMLYNLPRCLEGKGVRPDSKQSGSL